MQVYPSIGARGGIHFIKGKAKLIIAQVLLDGTFYLQDTSNKNFQILLLMIRIPVKQCCERSQKGSYSIGKECVYLDPVSNSLESSFSIYVCLGITFKSHAKLGRN